MHMQTLCLCYFLSPLQEAENTLRLMQSKLREEERELMKSSCKINKHRVKDKNLSHNPIQTFL